MRTTVYGHRTKTELDTLLGPKPLTLKEFLIKLPKTLPYPVDVWVGGGLALRGVAVMDIDIFISKDVFNHVFEIGNVAFYQFNKHIDWTLYEKGRYPKMIKIYAKGRLLR